MSVCVYVQVSESAFVQRMFLQDFEVLSWWPSFSLFFGVMNHFSRGGPPASSPVDIDTTWRHASLCSAPMHTCRY